MLLLKRSLAFLIDLIIVGAVTAILSFLPFHLFGGVEVFYIGIFIFFLKDLYGGNGSIGKSILGLKVYSIIDEEYEVCRRIIRNVFLLLYPIEFIVAFLNDGVRIGDLIAKTRVSLV